MGFAENVIPDWARSVTGKPIPLHFSNGYQLPEVRNSLLFVGGVHGNEPEGVVLARALLNWLRDCERKEMAFLEPWILVPCLNPDGFGKGERLNANGVDLNRNFPSKTWSAKFSEEKYNPGPQAGSEPETAALCQLIGAQAPRAIVHFHSWHPCVIVTGDASRLADIFVRGTGYKIYEEDDNETPGSLGDYAWLDHKIPVVCLEEDRGMESERIWPRFRPAFKELLLGRN